MVINLIDRKPRVTKARNRIEEAGVLLTRATNIAEVCTRKSKLAY